MVEFKNTFGKLDKVELLEFEKDNQITLPSDYKEFLEMFNGGLPSKSNIDKTGLRIQWFFGFHNGPNWSTTYNALDVYYKRVPSWYFPIAEDGFGNLYLMSLFDDNFGIITFWDHENENLNDADQYFDNMSFVATALTIGSCAKFIAEISNNM